MLSCPLSCRKLEVWGGSDTRRCEQGKSRCQWFPISYEEKSTCGHKAVHLQSPPTRVASPPFASLPFSLALSTHSGLSTLPGTPSISYCSIQVSAQMLRKRGLPHHPSYINWHTHPSLSPTLQCFYS